MLKTIFSNLGPTPTNAYDDTNGYFVAGPNSALGQAQWTAMQFTPKVNSTVTQLLVAVGYYFYGAKGFVVGLYTDNAGNVGSALATATPTASQIPDFGTCCKLVVVNISPTSVTAGTQYWVAVTSDDVNAPDFTGIWADSNTKAATSVGEGAWSSFRPVGLPAS